TVDYFKEYVEKARQQGIEELGISEHAYFFQETKDILSNPWVENRRGLHIKDYQAFFNQVRQADIPIKMGIEMDYTPGKEKEMEAFINNHPFDYVIGSVHWIGDWGIDLDLYKDEYEQRNIKEVYEDYYQQIITLAESKLFDFVGHIDLIKIFSYWPDDEAFMEDIYNKVVQALAKSGTCIEISSAGLRKPVGKLYPDPILLKKCYDAGVGIVLSSDAHAPKHVGYGYHQSLELARSVGYTTIQTFRSGVRTEHPLG